MRYLALAEALELHHRLIETSGGTHGLRDLGLLESALAQPRLTFDGEELYSDAIAKAGALAFSLIQNHVFLDGNKRIGHARFKHTSCQGTWACDVADPKGQRCVPGDLR